MKILLPSDLAVVLWPRLRARTGEAVVAIGPATYATSATNRVTGQAVAPMRVAAEKVPEVLVEKVLEEVAKVANATSATRMVTGRGIAQTSLEVVVARVAVHENRRVLETISVVTISRHSLEGQDLGVRDMHRIDVVLDWKVVFLLLPGWSI